MIPITERNKDLQYYYRNKDKISKRRKDKIALLILSNPNYKKEQKLKNAERYIKNRETILGYKRKWSINHPEKVLEAARKARIKYKDRNTNYCLVRKYGITLEEYNLLVAKQNGLCGMCQKPKDRRRFCVDHDHQTGKIRGLLCDRCNTGIGLIGDSHNSIKRALLYLERTL
jgi:hypothetical protein